MWTCFLGQALTGRARKAYEAGDIDEERFVAGVAMAAGTRPHIADILEAIVRHPVSEEG